MLQTINVNIALAGRLPQQHWQTKLIDTIRSWWSKTNKDTEAPVFFVPIKPSSVDFFPDNMDRYMDAVYAQEKLLATRADIVIYANDGSWDSLDSKKYHIEQLYKMTPIVLIWNPPDSQEDVLEADVPIRSGLVNVYGDMDTVASVICYLGLAQLHH